MQGKRTLARDSRGRPVPGIYIRDGVYSAGFRCPQTGRWRMVNLKAKTLTEAKRERDSLLAALREDRVAAPAADTFANAFEDYQQSRKLKRRTIKHEQHLLDRHLDAFKNRRLQGVTTREVARRLRELRDAGYAEWTRVGVYRIFKGTFDLAVRRGTLTRSPVDGLAPHEIPKQKNKNPIARLVPVQIAMLVYAATTIRWRAALGLGGYAGLRQGELRGLHWGDVDLDGNVLHVRRSLEPDGTPNPPKTEAGIRDVPILPALRRLLIEWKLEAPHTRDGDYVIATTDGKPVAERNLRRALADAKEIAGMDGGKARLSWHSLRHSCGSMLATDLGVRDTTLARVMGHTNASFTKKVYARDVRATADLVEDVLALASVAGVAS
jgi:integrase